MQLEDSNQDALAPNSAPRRAVSRLPAAILGFGALASVVTLIAGRAVWPVDVVAIDPLDVDPAMAALSALSLAAVAIGLFRNKRISWYLAVGTFVLALLAQSNIIERPLATIVLAGGLSLLLADRRRYQVQSNASWRRVGIVVAAVVAVVSLAEVAMYISVTGKWPGPLSALGDATASLGNALGIDDDSAAWMLRLASHSALFFALLLAARLPFALYALGALAPVPEPEPDPAVRDRARAIAADYGRGSLLPFQLGEDKLVFAPPAIEGVVVYGLAWRTAVMVGDPIGPWHSARPLVDAFVGRSRQLDRVPAAYQVSERGRRLLRSAGFTTFQIGQEAIVDLVSFDLSGSRRANLRHTVTRARKGGVLVEWHPEGLGSSELRGELEAIDVEWRHDAGPSMGFTISKFHPDEIGRQPAAVAVGSDGHALGFTTYYRISEGEWALDLIRWKRGGPPGVVEICLAEAALAMRDSGGTSLSLGLAPLSGLLPSSGPIAERLLARGAELVRPWYDTRGLAFFKGKFDPRWEPRYAAVQGQWHAVGLAVALLWLHLRPTDRRASMPQIVAPPWRRPADARGAGVK